MRRTLDLGVVVTLAIVVAVVTACEDAPVAPEAEASLDLLGRNGSTVTVPVDIRWGEGTFVVVPFADSRVPTGTPVENCPDGGLANPSLGLPAGFPNGGGIVISQGIGEGRHLGRLTETSTRCAVQFFPPTLPPLVNFDFRGTLTAADGSEIFIRGEYVKTPFTPSGVETKLISVAGGTGRFTGASGWLTPSRGLTVTCTDDSGLCLAGTWSGGTVEGELILRRPGRGN